MSAEAAALVTQLLGKSYQLLFWPAIGDVKGPNQPGWNTRQYTADDYHDGDRVGMMMGTPVGEGRYIHDIDIDWAPGSPIAQKLLPATGFVFGRASKPVSHCFYLLSEPLPSFRYEDPADKSVLLELRGTKKDGDIGLQTMIPPSVWSRDGQEEPLTFVRHTEPAFLADATLFRHRICLAAIGMLLAKHLGHNGFGHEVRLAWAGFLLRAGIPADDLIAMGEGISNACNNLETHDVRRSVEGTASRLAGERQKIRGGPALAKFIGDTNGKLVIDRINEWLGRDSDFIRTKDGSILKDSQENINRAAQLLNTYFSFDEFSGRMLVKDDSSPVRRLLDDRTVTSLWLKIDREFKFRPSYAFFEKVVMDLAYETSFHPVRDYLTTLNWDGIPRIDRWLHSYGGAEDSEYTHTISAIVLIAAVRRITDPGCKFDEMLILEGEQGLNKSSALRALCPDPEWFSDDLPLNVDSKQLIERTVGKWIVEASDLAGKRKVEIEQLKATLSRQVDGPARLAYARIPVERRRQFITIGTTNSSVYLVDPTGSRRFWPVTILRFDVEAIRRDCDQLWAEAKVREAAGASIRLPERLWGVAAGHQDERQEVDAWELILQDLLANRMPEADGRVRILLSDIWDVIQPDPTRRDRIGGMRISETMHRLGYVRGTQRIGVQVVRNYIGKPVKLDLGL